MSLETDIIFVRAIKSDAKLLRMLPAGDVYNTAIALPDMEADNAPVPYIIVSQGEVVNDIGTKDGYEGDTDSVTITIEVAARTRQELATMADGIRKTVRQFFENITDDDDDYNMVPLDYQFSARPVTYDQLKPCYWMELTYQCDVYTNLDKENE